MANKMAIYLMVMVGLMLLFNYAGFIPTTEHETILNMLINPSGMRVRDILGFDSIDIVVILESVALLGAVAIGIISGRIDLAIFGTAATFLLDIGFNFFMIYKNIRGALPAAEPLLILLFSPIIFLFVISVLEWWRGVTT